jgi:hypothetical protein
VVCMDNEKTHALIPCGHKCLCENCCITMMLDNICPICHNCIEGHVRVFM